MAKFLIPIRFHSDRSLEDRRTCFFWTLTGKSNTETCYQLGQYLHRGFVVRIPVPCIDALSIEHNALLSFHWCS